METRYTEHADKVDHLIVGHYGSGNLGDDIMLLQIIEEFRRNGKSFRVVLFGRHHRELGLSAGEYVLIDRSSKVGHLLALGRALLRSKSIVWGGGTCFTDEEGDGYFNGMVLAWLLRRDVHYRSVGVGSLTRLSRRLKFWLLLRMAKSITARDNASLSLLKGLAPTSTLVAFETDLGKTYIQEHEAEYSLSSDIGILVAWRDLSNYGIHTVVPLVRMIFEMNSSNEAIHLVTIDSVVDRIFNAKLAEELRHLGVTVIAHETTSAIEKLKLISRARVVVTARLHAMIAANEFGKEVFVYPYSKKIDLELQMSEHRATVVDPYRSAP